MNVQILLHFYITMI